MKTNLTAAECIAALRHCTDDGTELCVDDQYRCPLWNEDRMTDCCKADLMLAAADIIEEQAKQIAELEDEINNLENAYIAELKQAHINVQRSAEIYREWYEAVGSKRGKDNERA